MKVRRRVDLLFEEMLELFRQTLVGGPDADKAWSAIRRLQRRGNLLAFESAQAWCFSSRPLKRSRAASILAQLHRPKKNPSEQWHDGLIFRDKSFDLIAKILESEGDIEALCSEISALGHIGDLRAASLLVRFQSHSDSGVRYSLAHALGSLHEAPESEAALRMLMEDEDREVRDWAIFGVGVLGNADSEELRLQFLKHCDDGYRDARMEAAAALGKRRDARLAPKLVSMLRKDGDYNVLLEAARNLLQIEDDPDWSVHEFIAAIEERFGLAKSA